MSGKRRKSRRSAERYPALRRDLNLRTRADLIDYDYLHKLSPQELDWLDRFTAEYVGADFRHEKKLHKTQKARRDCYHRNNARNRCIFTTAKASGRLSSMDDPSKKSRGDHD